MWEWKVKVKLESGKLNIGFNEVKKVDKNKLTNIHGNSLIFDWQYVDCEDILKKVNMFGIVKLKVKRESEIEILVLMKWKNEVDLNKLIPINGNLFIINWQNADHEYLFKYLIYLTYWKWMWKVSEK